MMGDSISTMAHLNEGCDPLHWGEIIGLVWEVIMVVG